MSTSLPRIGFDHRQMQVSVIIPVYNAGRFVARAVESALEQSETAEVILVEDGSQDNSLEVCRRLASAHGRVQLFRHPEGRNLGAGASRNSGMRIGSHEFIAFLDADDYYLPDRFSEARRVLEAVADCEGVYEAVGHHVDSDAGLQRWTGASKPPVSQLTTLSRKVRPEELGCALISGGYGYFHLDGLVLKRGVLEKSGYVSEALRLHQDTEFIIRVATVARLLPGRSDEPVAMVGVHELNRISAPRSEDEKYRDRMLMWTELYGWCKQRRLEDIQLRIMTQMILQTISKKRFGVTSRRILPRPVLRLCQLLKWIARSPGMLIEPQLWRSMNALLLARTGTAGETQ